jgi:predicted dehydrogenase
VNTLVIATRHDTHAAFVVKALAAGKHVFVEKPLGITAADLDAIEAAWVARPAADRQVLLVGFNRRFAPQIVRMKSLLDSQSVPKSLIVTINAGAVPAGHWTRSAKEGGGRLVGEGCHFIDLMRFLVGVPIAGCQVSTLGTPAGGPQEDKATVTLTFQDGSVGTLHYFANGHPSFPKERVEVFCGGRILQLDNFRRLRGYGWNSRAQLKSWRQDKGQGACVAAFIAAIRAGRQAPIPFPELIEVSRFSLAAAQAAHNPVP